MPVCFAPITGPVMHVICVAVLLFIIAQTFFPEKKRISGGAQYWIFGSDIRWSSSSHRACDLCCCLLCFQLQRHFFWKKKSDGKPYTVLDPCVAVTADGPVVYILHCKNAGMGSNAGFCSFEL